MNVISRQLLTIAGVGALTSACLFASASPAQHRAAQQDRFVNEVETVLAMTPTQKDQAQTAMEQARQAAMPIRQELMNTNRSLQAAVKSDSTSQIQQLSSTEGHEIGQLLAIRSSAVAKVYSTLTPTQQTKADALHRLMMQAVDQPAAHTNARLGS